MKKKKYRVALEIDDHAGNIDYCNEEIIEARSKRMAEREYNIKNGCNYCHGVCLGRYHEKNNFLKRWFRAK